MSLFCYISGHIWKFNFASLPNKCICARCERKMVFDLDSNTWKPVNTFEGEKRTNKELINKWIQWIQ